MRQTTTSPHTGPLAFLLLTLFLTAGAFAQATTLVTEDFDPDGEGVTYTSSAFDDGGEDFFERLTANPDPRHNAPGFTGFTFTPPQGGSYWGGEDIEDGMPSNPLGDHGIVRLNNLAVAGFNNLKVRVFLAQSDSRFDIEDKIEIQAAVDGNLPGTPTNLTQGTYTTIGRFIGNGMDIFASEDLKQDSDLDGAVFGDGDDAGSPVLTTTMTEYVFDVPFIGNTLSVQVRIEQNGGSEEIVFDHIRVEGTASANTAPVLAAIEGASIMYAEGDPATQVTNTITVSDADAGDMIESASIQITANNDPTEDVLADDGSVPAGITVNAYVPATGTLSLTGAASVADYQTALRAITYQNTDAVNPSTAIRTVQFLVNDGDDNSNTQTRNVQITAFMPLGMIPHTEDLDTDGEGARYTSSTYNMGGMDFFERSTTNPHPGHGGAFTFTPPQGGSFWAAEDVNSAGNPLGDHGIFRIQNLDSTGLAGLQVHLYLGELAGLSESDDKIEIQYAFDGNIPANSTDLSSGTYATIGRFVPDSPDVFTPAPMKLDSDLDGVTNGDPDDAASPTLSATMTEYTFDIPVTGNTLSVQVRIEQNGGMEEIAFDQIRVTGLPFMGTPPVLANIEPAAVMYTEGDPATQITNAITVADPDPSEIASATVQITGNYAMGEDVLADNGSVPAGIMVGAFDAGSGTLSLTGTASPGDYETALRAITYENTDGVNPSVATRTVSFQCIDGDALPSNFQTRDIEIANSVPAATIPHLEDFDTDGEGARYTSSTFNTGPLESFFERLLANPDPRHDGAFTFTPPQSMAYWGSENVENPANPLGDHGIVRLQDLDTTGIPMVTLSLFLAEIAPKGEGPQDKIEIQIAFDGNGGGTDLTAGTYTTIGRFVPDSPDIFTEGSMTLDRDLDGVTNGDAIDDAPAATLTSTMQEFTFDIPVMGNTLSVQIRTQQNGGTEEIAFDHIAVAAPVSLDNFLVEASPTTLPTGSASTVTVTARDAANMPIPDYTDAVNDIAVAASSANVTYGMITDDGGGLGRILAGTAFDASGQLTFTAGNAVAEGPVMITVTALGGETGNTNESGTDITWTPAGGGGTLVPTLSPIALTGDLVPNVAVGGDGVMPGAPAGLPASTKFLAFTQAYLNGNDNILLQALIFNDPSINGGNNRLVMTNTPGDLRIVARNEPASAGASVLRLFQHLRLSDTTENSFQALLHGTPTLGVFEDLAVLRHDGIGFIGITADLEEGTIPPDVPGTTFTYLWQQSMNQSGSLAIPGWLDRAPAGITTFNDSGIWADYREPFIITTPADLEAPEGAPPITPGMPFLLVREGDPISAPPFGGLLYSQIFNRVVFNTLNEVAFTAYISGVPNTSNAAIFAGIPPSAPLGVGFPLFTAVRRGDIADGTMGAKFNAFSAESINLNAEVAFRSYLTGGDVSGASNNLGVWRTGPAAPPILVLAPDEETADEEAPEGGLPVGTMLVARKGNAAPISPAPPAPAFFDRFIQMIIADEGTLYFDTFLKGMGVATNNDYAIFKHPLGGPAELVMREGDPAPEVTGGIIQQIVSFGANTNGEAVIIARLVPNVGTVTGSNNLGLFFDRNDGNGPLLLLQKGDPFLVAPGDIRTVLNFNIERTTNFQGGSGGHGQSVNNNEKIAIRLNYSSGSGVFLLGIGPES